MKYGKPQIRKVLSQLGGGKPPKAVVEFLHKNVPGDILDYLSNVAANLDDMQKPYTKRSQSSQRELKWMP